MPPIKKIINKTIKSVSKLITGKPELLGNVNDPKEQRHTDPVTIAAIDAVTKIA